MVPFAYLKASTPLPFRRVVLPGQELLAGL
jgi:hypothetical protein